MHKGGRCKICRPGWPPHNAPLPLWADCYLMVAARKAKSKQKPAALVLQHRGSEVHWVPKAVLCVTEAVIGSDVNCAMKAVRSIA
eukprot:603642-Pelagomonas_calceolata.AAC.4